MLEGKEKQRFGVEHVGGGGVLQGKLFSLHTLGTEHASAPCQRDVSSLQDVYFCGVVCGSQNVSFIPKIVCPDLTDQYSPDCSE